jgi:phosphoglycolate phosphatase
VASLLVLWDVDHTLIVAGGVGFRIYERAFRDMFSLEVPSVAVPMAGRTDRAIALDLLTEAGVPDPRGQVAQFQAMQAQYAPELAPEMAARGRVLPGVPEAIAAVAQGRPGLRVVQSLLTGNVRALAEVKVGALGLTDHLDLDAGAYGTESEIRADLVPVARRNASGRYDEDFSGAATVLVGDTPLDVEAALATGARVVGVGTGMFTVEELLAAGAHAAFPDLSDTGAVVSAILGPA